MDKAIYTIGHSTHSLVRFVALLKKHAIETVCDVRSHPYSRINPQFNRETLQHALKVHGIIYMFLGKELGARSGDPAAYVNGKVSYDHLAKTGLFKSGLERIRAEIEHHRIVLMCAEKEPLTCHRTILISRHLHQSGSRVMHILESGGLEGHEESLTRLLRLLRLPETDIFKSQEEIIAEAYQIQGAQIAYEFQRVEDQALKAKKN